MPDRNKVKLGDVVLARWFDNPRWFVGVVKKDEEGLYIDCDDGTVGYLEDADEVIKAIKHSGNLMYCKNGLLHASPILSDGTVDLESETIVDSSGNPDEISKLQEIAKRLNCKLY